MSPRIAIIGAGPGGLTLARLLQRSSIIPTIYERDTSAESRSQGGTLDLHAHSGQRALRDAGLWDEFLKHARYDAQTMKVMVKSGDIIFQDEPGPDNDSEHSRPEIDRTALRDLLLQAVGVDNVIWNHPLASVQPGADGKFDLHFKDGKVEPGFDLVVGADGTWSRVRPHITSVAPFYSGISWVELNISNPKEEKLKAVSELVGAGSAIAFSDGKSIQAQRLGTGEIRTGVSFSTDKPDWLNRFDATNPATAKADILTYFEDWAPALRDVVLLSDDSVRLAPLYMLPVGDSWESRPGLTLLGDAAHVMTPYAGEGVNNAMWDSLELGKAIIAGVKSGDLNERVQVYEQEMFKRAADSARRSNRNKEGFFALNFPEPWAAMLQEMMQGGQGGPEGPQ